MSLKIVADRNILALENWKHPDVDLRLFDGRHICADDVKGADALLVRSITRVDASLLAGSNVKFVATATSGTDHIDAIYLQQQGIEFASAAGANAAAVADYVMCCLAELTMETGFSLAGKKVAVIGVGHVGSALLRRLQLTGATCLACDPFQQICPGVPYVAFDDAIKADVICLHTPLTRTGEYPTFHLLNADNLARLSADAIVINAGRGEVIDNHALLVHLEQLSGSDTRQRFILDVWEGEPNPDKQLVASTYLATPHIAGYSVEAKYAASARILSALCQHFSLPVPELSVPDTPPVYHVDDADSKGQSCPESDSAGTVNTATRAAQKLLATFSPRKVDAAFREAYLAADNPDTGATSFDSIRRSLMARRENQA